MVALNETRRSRPSRAAYARLPRENPPPPRSCSAPRSPSVQRARYYDPSTAEFTSRDPLEYVDGVSLYRGYFLPTGIDFGGRLTIKPLGQRFLKCGKVSGIAWDFVLDVEPGCNGWIVQKINIKCGETTCDECSTNPANNVDITFLEAWRVTRPSRYVDRRLKDDGSLFNVDDFNSRVEGSYWTDISSMKPEFDSCGKKVTNGEVRFYCDEEGKFTEGWETGQVHIDPANPNSSCGNFSTGDLPHLVIKDGNYPDFWKNNPVEGPAFRKYEVSWQCCHCFADYSVISDEVTHSGEPAGGHEIDGILDNVLGNYDD
jgi:hypothetical protein